MGNKKYTRRNFFRSVTTTSPSTTDAPFGDTEDPLFQKYSRKKLTPRTYSVEESQLKVGTEDKDDQRSGAPVTSGLAPYTGTWSEWEAMHLIRRTNFGIKKAWVDALVPLGVSAAVDAVLTISTTPPAPPVNWYQSIYADESAIAGNNNATDNPAVAYGTDWTNHYFSSTTNAANTSTNSNGQNTNHNRMDGLRRWSFGLTLNGDVSIREKMVWFWYHFIPIDFESIYQSSNSYVVNNCARFFYRYMKLFRDNALGSFKTIIRAIAVDPSMMYYLNNQANSATAPDENFAREVMELFTLGKDDPNNTYSQSDVVAAAQVLTGWRVQNVNTATPATNFVSASHKTGNKTFSSFFGGKVIPSIAANAGAPELDEFINMLFSKQVEVSKYICRRLYRYFVYYDIDANVEANVITPLAQTFVSNNWNIQPVMAQLLKSQHFFDMANRGCYIKSPFDFVAGLLNSFSVNTTDANIEYQYRIWGMYNDTYCSNMEQRMGSIPNVSGWNAYYQTPAYHEYWINSNSIQQRVRFLNAIIPGYHTISGVYVTPATTPASLRRFSVDTVAFVQQFGNTIVADPNALVNTCIKYLFPVDLSQTKKDDIKNRNLLNSLFNDTYWTGLWNTYVATPNTTNRKAVEDKLKGLINELCQYADFQLM